MATRVPALEYIPVAVIARLPDGQFVVLGGQAEQIEHSSEPKATRMDYETTVRWRPGVPFNQHRMPANAAGVAVFPEDDGRGGHLFRLVPLSDV